MDKARLCVSTTLTPTVLAGTPPVVTTLTESPGVWTVVPAAVLAS
jgi:hypothetical protein